MRTPAGTECRHYYEDFNRGRQTQECRLIKANTRSLPWTPPLCAKCRVPDVLRANGSPHLRLELTVRKRFGLFTALELTGYCGRHAQAVADLLPGCAACRAEDEPRATGGAGR